MDPRIHGIRILAADLQWFAESPKKVYYKSAVRNYFCPLEGSTRDPLDKNRGFENASAPNPNESTTFGQKGLQTRAAEAGAHRMSENVAFERFD